MSADYVAPIPSSVLDKLDPAAHGLWDRDRLAQVWKLWYGLTDRERDCVLSPRAVAAERHGISKSRAYEISSRALRKLRLGLSEV